MNQLPQNLLIAEISHHMANLIAQQVKKSILLSFLL